MCNHLATPSDEQILAEAPELAVPEIPELFHLNAFSHPEIPIQTMPDPDEIQMAEWGLVANFAKVKTDFQKKYATVNARNDKILTPKSMYRPFVAEQRCLIWVTGFYEYHEQPDKFKIPHFIYMPGKPAFTMGGLYNIWNGQLTTTIITTDANERMAFIHNKKKRMPLIIPPNARKTWLSGLDDMGVEEMLLPLADGVLADHTVSKSLLKLPPTDPQNQEPEVYEGYEG